MATFFFLSSTVYNTTWNPLRMLLLYGRCVSKSSSKRIITYSIVIIYMMFIPSVEMIETSGTWRIQRRIQRRIEFVDLLLLIATTGRQQMARSTRSTSSSSYTDELIIASATSDPLPVRPEFTCWIWKQWIKRLLISLHIESSTHTQREETNKRWQIHVVVGLFNI